MNRLKRESSLGDVTRGKQGHIVLYVQPFQYPRTVNSVSILFTWHKNLGGVIKRHSYLPRRKVSHGCRETNRELERIFNSYRYQVKKYVIDLFIYLHCFKCVLMKATCEREI